MAAPSAAQALTFTVNSTDDAPDANLDGDCDVGNLAPGPCTLRAAIQEASFAAFSEDTIIVPAGTYQLTLGPAGDDAGGSGDLDVNDGDIIQGIDGAASTQVIQTLADRVFDVRASQDNDTAMAISGLRISGGELGGIRIQAGGGGTTNLTLTDSTVDGNTNASGTFAGGGIEVLGTGSTQELTLVRSTVSGNQANDGGGIWIGDGARALIQNSTISGNTANVTGGGVRARESNASPEGRATIENSTITGNVAPTNEGGGLAPAVANAISLKQSIVAGNMGGNCDPQIPLASQGHNMENTNTCGLAGTGDQTNTDPQLGALASNGGETQTHALPSGSPAVNAIPAADCPPPGVDQRGISRPQGGACDKGAYEFVPSKTVPSVPDCSPTGAITLTMDPPAGETPVAFKYKVDDGPTQTAPTSDETETINLSEGSFKLEYWSQTSAGEEPQANHLVDTAVVDMTDPTLSVGSDQNQDIYVITRNASVTVNADDALSGLTVDPSAEGEQVTTLSRGQKTVEWSAVDLCDNTTTKTFDYTVLGPVLAERAVIEPLGEDVKVKVPDGGAAHASQKGADFEAVEQPREIPIGSIIDARDGEARITSSKSTIETDIQDGEFVDGVFQVLQSRNEERKGLTKLRLRKGNFNKCDDGKGASAALSRRAIRRLRARARGRFRTSGRYSAATVRGTRWTVTDRCDGTLTEVRRGKVAVRDFRLQETIILKRGKSYLALAEPPPPELGKTVNVDVLKGKVFIKLPRHGEFARASQKGTDFVPLTSERSIPVRSILDTRKGTVALRSARNRKGKIQSGRFADGVFQVLQSRKRREKGLTTLKLKGSAAKFRRCGKGGSASARAALTRRQIRRLRARARGRYRTGSRYSAATVRGTVWTVTDRCDGTLTQVKRGSVAVRDFRLKKTITVRAGKSYLAKPG